MYCIDGGCTLKNRKPTLILESLNKDQNKNAKSKLSALVTSFDGYLSSAVSSFTSAPVLNWA